MSLFKWSKKTVEAMKEEAPKEKDYMNETLDLYKKYMEEAYEAKYKPASVYFPPGTHTISTSSVPAPLTFGSGTLHGSYIKLADLERHYGIEPYAVIKLAEYFARLGISTEEQAQELIEELKRV